MGFNSAFKGLMLNRSFQVQKIPRTFIAK